MDGRRNYFLGNTAFSAIRVSDAHRLVRQQETIDEAAAQRLERIALSSLQAYGADKGAGNLEDVLTAVRAYAELVGEVTERTRRDYRETLARQPWDYCKCSICEAIKIEVLIFRGNNRNRRRGFHNTWQLYQQLHGHKHGLPPPLNAADPCLQRPLDL